MQTIFLLAVSNIFMTIAWYGHLKYKASSLWAVILPSWGISFVEYCVQVPANRIEHYQFNATQLKTIQEDRPFIFSMLRRAPLRHSLR
jgi:uncharacterized protein (DUF486 family)